MNKSRIVELLDFLKNNNDPEALNKFCIAYEEELIAFAAKHNTTYRLFDRDTLALVPFTIKDYIMSGAGTGIRHLFCGIKYAGANADSIENLENSELYYSMPNELQVSVGSGRIYRACLHHSFIDTDDDEILHSLKGPSFVRIIPREQLDVCDEPGCSDCYRYHDAEINKLKISDYWTFCGENPPIYSFAGNREESVFVDNYLKNIDKPYIDITAHDIERARKLYLFQ